MQPGISYGHTLTLCVDERCKKLKKRRKKKMLGVFGITLKIALYLSRCFSLSCP